MAVSRDRQVSLPAAVPHLLRGSLNVQDDGLLLVTVTSGPSAGE